MTKESTRVKTRERFKKLTGRDAIDPKTGKRDTEYDPFLLSDKCTVPWMSNWSPIRKAGKVYKTSAGIMKDLKVQDKANRLDENCMAGGVGGGQSIIDTAAYRRENRKKFNIANY